MTTLASLEQRSVLPRISHQIERLGRHVISIAGRVYTRLDHNRAELVLSTVHGISDIFPPDAGANVTMDEVIENPNEQELRSWKVLNYNNTVVNGAIRHERASMTANALARMTSPKVLVPAGAVLSSSACAGVAEVPIAAVQPQAQYIEVQEDASTFGGELPVEIGTAAALPVVVNKPPPAETKTPVPSPEKSPTSTAPAISTEPTASLIVTPTVPLPPENIDLNLDIDEALASILRLSPDVDVASPTGNYRVDISQTVMDTWGLSSINVPPEVVQDMESALKQSLSDMTTRLKKENGATDEELITNPPQMHLVGDSTAVDVEMEPIIKLMIVGSQEYVDAKSALAARGIESATLSPVGNDTDSLVVFSDAQHRELTVIQNAERDLGETFDVRSNPEQTVAYYLSSFTAFLRRMAFGSGRDSKDFELRTGIPTRNADDIYHFLGCNGSNGGCSTGSGGVIQFLHKIPQALLSRYSHLI